MDGGWKRLEELVDAYDDSNARHQAFVDGIAPAIHNIHAYWLARRAPTGAEFRTPRQPFRKAPAPGGNDPCPCGGGKKFKRCHGAH